VRAEKLLSPGGRQPAVADRLLTDGTDARWGAY